MPMDRRHTRRQMKLDGERIVDEAELSSAGNLPFPRTFDDFSLLESGLRGKNYVKNTGDENDYFKYRPKARKSVDPQLLAVLEFFRELYFRRRDLFQKLFPKLHEQFAQFSESLEDLFFREVVQRSGDGLRRSLSVGSPRTTSREIGSGDLPLKLERFKVRMVDLDDDVPLAGGEGGTGAGSGSGGQDGGQGGKGGTKPPGGSTPK